MDKIIKMKKFDRMTNSRKSQAAFEFLVTYGWAIFGVLIVLAGLAYFGFFNTQKFVNDECNFGDQLRCEDYILRGSNAVLNMTLRNNFGVNIDIISVRANSDYGLNIACTSSPSSNITAGRLFNASCDLYASTIPKSEKVDVDILVVFRRNSTTTNPSHNLTGSLVVTAQ